MSVMEWTSPLQMSILRLVFITSLSVANWGALWKVTSTNIKIGGRRPQERLLVTTIIVTSLVYLTLVWAPFTLSALSHDLQDTQKAEEFPVAENMNPPETNLSVLKKENEVNEFVVEYIDIANGLPVIEKNHILSRSARATTGKVRASWTLVFPTDNAISDEAIQDSGPLVKSLAFPSSDHDNKGISSLSWDSDVQDLVTSSCAYTLAFTAVFRMILMGKCAFWPCGSWAVGVGAGMLVGIPAVVTLMVRTLGVASTHFARHNPEFTAAGYFLYNFICDVHITEDYVVSLFLEWAALFTLLLLMLAGAVGAAVKSSKTKLHPDYVSLKESNVGSVESWSRDVVVVIGAVWAWPLKPLLVLILYCIYGQHWTNLVCWLSHVVIAIPVVFIPLSVFLSTHKSHSKTDTKVCDPPQGLKPQGQCDDIEFTKGIPTDTKELNGSAKLSDAEAKEVTKVYDNDKLNFVCTQEKDLQDPETQNDPNKLRENLKFYLGTDILKYGLNSAADEDRRIILKDEWDQPSFSDV